MIFKRKDKDSLRSGGDRQSRCQCVRLRLARRRSHGLQYQVRQANGRAQPVSAELKTLHGEAAGKRTRCGGAALGRVVFAVICSVGRGCVLRVGDFSAHRSRGFKAGAKAAANGSQRIERGLNGNPRKFNGEMRRRAFSGQNPRDMHAAVPQRRVASQVLECPAGVVVLKAAIGVEIEGHRGSELGAMHALCAQPGLYLRCFSVAIHMQLAGQVAPPSGVCADDQLGQLAQLRLPPLQVKVHRHLVQCGSLPAVCIQSHHPGVGQVETEIRAGRLACQPDAPFAGTLLPE